MIDLIRHEWREGECHGIPMCCRARFIVGRLLPKPLARIAPNLSARLAIFTPRRVLMDGVVPCELHALHWLLTGSKKGWRKPMAPKMCCSTREEYERHDLATLRHVTEFGQDLTGKRIEVNTWVLENWGETTVGINNCPWCGAKLETP